MGVDIVRFAHAPISDAEVARVVERVMRKAKICGNIDVAFVGKRRMRFVNQTYHGEDCATDVLAFSGERRKAGADLGEIIICPQIAKRNARRAEEPWKREIVRLLIHGTLHLEGYSHATPKKAARMFLVQERLVASVR